MKTKEFLKKSGKVAIATLRWLGFLLFEAILTGFNLLIIGAVIFYFSYVFGSTPRIEPDHQSVSIKKVDGFYLIQGTDYGRYQESPFPDCKIKFHNKVLEFKSGDIYDGTKCVTDQVSIQGTRSGFRVYYLKHSYPLTTLTNIEGTYHSDWTMTTEKREMYAKDGLFYIDVDERHGIIGFFLLCFVLAVLIVFRKCIVEITRNWFENEYEMASDFVGNNIIGPLGTIFGVIFALIWVIIISPWKMVRKLMKKKKIKKI